MSITEKLGLREKTSRKLVFLAGAIVLLWVLFFDSHSILHRATWTVEAHKLRERNEQLHAEIDSLKTEIEHADDPENVERVARENYGMRRKGETVYRVEEATD